MQIVVRNTQYQYCVCINVRLVRLHHPWVGCHKHPQVFTHSHTPSSARGAGTTTTDLQWHHLVVTSALLHCVSEVLIMHIFALPWLVVGRPEGEGQGVPIHLVTVCMQSRELQSFLASALGGG